MNYLTNYYKNLSEKLQKRYDVLLNEAAQSDLGTNSGSSSASSGSSQNTGSGNYSYRSEYINIWDQIGQWLRNTAQGGIYRGNLSNVPGSEYPPPNGRPGWTFENGNWVSPGGYIWTWNNGIWAYRGRST